ncbi:MAG TPA: NADPH-dependent FMN reductase [Candidatus Binataceae bacterium]|nr:NADPH-dependent FMN reductase [Candidatus Binataceae bacterium]
MKLVLIVGSVTPPGRLSGAVRWLRDTAQATYQSAAELIDLADKRLSFADGRPPASFQDDTAAVVASVHAADAVIIATPVYRGSITGALKNLLDHLPVEALASKPVGIIAMGATPHHFLGADWHLRDILAWFGALVMPTSVYLTSADFVEGRLVDSARQDLTALLDAAVKLTALAAPGNFLGPPPFAARR